MIDTINSLAFSVTTPADLLLKYLENGVADSKTVTVTDNNVQSKIASSTSVIPLLV